MNRARFDLDAFFPRLRRGHSLGAHAPYIKVVDGEGKTVRRIERKPHCAEALCVVNNPKSKIRHIDQSANIEDWNAERSGTNLKTGKAFFPVLEDLKLRQRSPYLYQQPAA